MPDAPSRAQAEPLRILFFRSVCDTGGISSWMLRHARELSAAGNHCEFLFCEGSNRLPEFERAGRTMVAPIDRLIDLVKTDAYDVVHIPSGDPMAEVLQFVKVVPKLVATNHGGIAGVWHKGNCHARTAVSEAMARMDQPLTDLVVEAIPNGVDCAHFFPGPHRTEVAEGGPVIAWVGRTTSIRQKDFPRFLRVGALLAKRGARLWVADAHGADWAPFEKLGLERPPIERWDRVSYDEMPAFYRSVAATGGVLLMTSPYEGFGLVAAEAAACGLTIVAPDAMGLRESVVKQSTGTHYPLAASDEDVAERVLRWVSEWTPARGGVAANEACVRFAGSVMTARYLEIYRRASPLVFQGTAIADMSDADTQLVYKRRDQFYWNRVYGLTQAALQLSESGDRALALRVLGLIARTAPKVFRNPKPRRRMLAAALNIMNPLVTRGSSRSAARVEHAAPE